MSFDQLLPSLLGQLDSTIIPGSLRIAAGISPIILAVILAEMFWKLWVQYVRAKNFLSIKYTVLEIRLPKDTFKSPLAMEVFLTSLHNTSNGSNYSQFWKGETRPWYSLELISIEGNVKFMIWTEDRRKNGVMSALYSQFPGIEVYEREDYAQSVHFDPKTMKVWGGEFVLTKDDPYPIKTYVDYGLDKDPKEEFKIDPLTPFIEFLGNVGPNQQIWIQIMIRAHIKDQKKAGHLWKRTDLYKEKAEELVNKILIRDPKTKVSGAEDPETGLSKKPTISKGEERVIEAIERAMGKLPFDVGIRCLYIAKKESFDTPFGIGGIVGNWKHFNTENLNGFRPNGDKWHTQFSGAPWEDYKDGRRNRYSKRVLQAYKRRSFFYPPFKGKPLILNTEELATIYHFPGQVAATPSLDRVPSKKAEAPSNLPI